jgi:hypothetical protein
MKNKLIIVLFILISFSAVSYADNYGMLGKRFLSIGVVTSEYDNLKNNSLGYEASFNLPLDNNLDLNVNLNYSSIEQEDFPLIKFDSYGDPYVDFINYDTIFSSLDVDMVYRFFRKSWVTPFLSLGAGFGERKIVIEDLRDTEEFFTYGGLSGFEIKPFNKIFLLTYYSRQYLKFLFLDYEQPPVESLHIMFGFWPSDFMSLVLHYGTDINSDTDSSVQMYGISCNLKI